MPDLAKCQELIFYHVLSAVVLLKEHNPLLQHQDESHLIATLFSTFCKALEHYGKKKLCKTHVGHFTCSSWPFLFIYLVYNCAIRHIDIFLTKSLVLHLRWMVSGDSIKNPDNKKWRRQIEIKFKKNSCRSMQSSHFKWTERLWCCYCWHLDDIDQHGRLVT